MFEEVVQDLNFEDHTAAINGVALHFRAAGSGPPLFLVSPGWGIGSTYLQRGFASLAEHFRLIFIDTRGSGRSSRPADAAKMSSVDMADDLEALRVQIGLPPVNVLGHSNSGAIALSFAERYPDRVNKLVLIDSQVLGLSGAAETQRILQERASDPRFEEAVKAISPFFAGQLNPGQSDEALESFIAQILPLYLGYPEKTLAVTAQHVSGPISAYAFSSIYAADAAKRTDLTQDLHRITAKVLIASGRHDFICPVMLAQHLHQGIPDAKLVIFEESGHFPWLEEPEHFFKELKNFLLS